MFNNSCSDDIIGSWACLFQPVLPQPECHQQRRHFDKVREAILSNNSLAGISRSGLERNCKYSLAGSVPVSGSEGISQYSPDVRSSARGGGSGAAGLGLIVAICLQEKYHSPV